MAPIRDSTIYPHVPVPMPRSHGGHCTFQRNQCVDPFCAKPFVLTGAQSGSSLRALAAAVGSWTLTADLPTTEGIADPDIATTVTGDATSEPSRSTALSSFDYAALWLRDDCGLGKSDQTRGGNDMEELHCCDRNMAKEQNRLCH
ncbi:hypothetical protein HJFPF1_08434 [Paramyrothecium foliicola]|nr:hypothetical protein HJFPF1_08434 [Paramyrothecium foliicola]